MRNAAAIALLAMLAGCYTPGEIRDQGTRHERAVSLPPAEAASCMARHANDYGMGVYATVNGNEVVVRGSESAFAVATAAPGKATIWLGPNALLLGSLPDAMAKGC